MKHSLNMLPVVLLLAGCGGADFSGTADPEGTGGAGTGGATGSTGGVTGVTGGGTSVTGGSGGEGTGGAATGGAATGGQVGTGGQATGGQVGTGGAATCTPPVVSAADLPATIVWDSYLSHITYFPVDQCLTCVNSPCATCDVTWYPVSQSADGLTLTAKAAVQCGTMPMNLGACGNDPTLSSCTDWTASNISSTLVFSLQPKSDGSGYTASYLTQNGLTGGVGSNIGTCPTDAYNAAVQANQPFYALFDVLRDAVTATEWPCGG